MRFKAAALLFGAITIATSTASAQLNPFPGRAPRLTPQDREFLVETTNKLNNAPSPAAGQTEKWNNPQTGAHGTTSLTRVYRHNGMTCHALRYQFAANQTRSLRTFDIDWCKTAEGRWMVRS